MKVYKFYRIPDEARYHAINASKERLKQLTTSVNMEIEEDLTRYLNEYELDAWTSSKKRRDIFKLYRNMSNYLEISCNVEEDSEAFEELSYLHSGEYLEYKELSSNRNTKIRMLLTDNDYELARAVDLSMFLQESYENLVGISEPEFFNYKMFMEEVQKSLYYLSYDIISSVFNAKNTSTYDMVASYMNPIDLRSGMIPPFWNFIIAKMPLLNMNGLTEMIRILNRKKK